MAYKDLPFRITSGILSSVASITEAVGRFSSVEKISSNLMLRKDNRIKSIYSSLAIEQNSLTLDQVTALLEGKRVIGPPKDIKEVQNAYEIYERLDLLDPFSAEDLLSAHYTMTKDLVQESGMFRTGNVGIVDKDGNVLHFGTLPSQVPFMVADLMEWTKNSDLPMLIKSCVFHYEFEVIHPFADGNGRVGRLWHTLLLSKWNKLFAWLPVESIIHDRQEDYYRAFNRSNAEGESTVFIEFMLSAIEDALNEAMGDEQNSSAIFDYRWHRIRSFLLSHANIKNADVRVLFSVSSATANRILASLCESEKIKRVRDGKTLAYELFTDSGN